MVFGTPIALLIQSGRGLVLLRFDSGHYKKETIIRIAFCDHTCLPGTFLVQKPLLEGFFQGYPHDLWASFASSGRCNDLPIEKG